MARIGLGTAALGRPLYINVRDTATREPFSLEAFKKEGIRVLDDAYDKGIRFFDTSPGYGLAERLLMDWLDQKKDVAIEVTTKWGYTYVANFDPNAAVHEVKEHSLDKLNEQWGFSKKLLPYLKTYQIHSATLETGVLENTDVLNRLHGLKEKHGLQIGLTTTGSNQQEVLQKALDVDVQGVPLFSSAQVTFNILDQSLMDMKPVLEHRNMQLLVKEALANGRLIPNDHYGQYQKLYAYLAKLGAQYHVGTDAIALRFVMDIFPSAIVLSGANNGEHLTANLKAETFELSERELETLRQFSTAPETYWNERKQLSWN